MFELFIRAEASKASEYASGDLYQARQKLDAAEAAIRADEYEHARRLAEEATANAELAETKAYAEIARRNAEEIRKNIETLQNTALESLATR